MKDRVILAPLNADIYKINDKIIWRSPGEYNVYKSNDFLKDQSEGASQFTFDFLNCIEMTLIKTRKKT